MRGGKVPSDDQQNYLIRVTALERATDGIKFVAEAMHCIEHPLFGSLSEALRVLVVVDDVGDGGGRNVCFARHVFHCRPVYCRPFHVNDVTGMLPAREASVEP